MRSPLFSISRLTILPLVVFLSLGAVEPATAQVNAGLNTPNTSKPFEETTVANFDVPWALAFFPDGKMLVTEKAGRLFLVTQQGIKQQISGVPKVKYEGQNGLLDVAISPHFGQDRSIYLTYSEPGSGGSSLALARAQLTGMQNHLTLSNLQVIWRQMAMEHGGQPGGIVAFSPDGKYLFLTVGDRMHPEVVQDPDKAFGKILRLNLDGSTPSDNPMASQGGVKAQTWTTGHRNPYGLAFAPDGQLWSDEMGPMGGDELNLLKPGRNYGWPIVSNGDNYDGTPIPRHTTHPEFEPPVVYWTPVIAPAGLAFYTGKLFPDWQGSAFIGGLKAEVLVRIAFDANGGAREADRWDMGHRIRDVAVAPDGAIWLIDDESNARLLRLTPKK